jgi:phosphohistidine phosphatase
VETRRTLVLVRHAKAGPDGDVDAERPLTERGIQDAAAIGRVLAERDIAPDRVLVSPAVRAGQTWNAAAAALPGAAVPTPDPRIYRNTVADLLDVLHDVPDDALTVVLVGHAPGVPELAAALDDGAGADLPEDFSTAGVAVLDVATGWSALTGATVRSFAVGRG